MTLFDLFSKRRRFRALYDRVWAAIEPNLAIKAGPELPEAHRLACFYYASVVYAIVYQSALAAGMSTSSAFSVARIHLSKYPFDAALRGTVDRSFSADAGLRERDFSERLQATIEPLVTAARAGRQADPTDVAGQLATLEETLAGLDLRFAEPDPPAAEPTPP